MSQRTVAPKTTSSPSPGRLAKTSAKKIAAATTTVDENLQQVSKTPTPPSSKSTTKTPTMSTTSSKKTNLNANASMSDMVGVTTSNGASTPTQSDNRSVRSASPINDNGEPLLPLLCRDLEAYPMRKGGNPLERYAGLVYWAKMPHFVWWPCRVIDEEEAEEEDWELPPAGHKRVIFLGSEDMAIVKDQNLVPYVENFNRHHRKSKKKDFLLGLEMADGVVLKSENKGGTDFCMICLGSDQEDAVLICDHCDGESHMFCLDPPLSKVPKGEWFCPNCVVNAPLSFKASEIALAKAQALAKKKRVALGGGSTSPTASSSSVSGSRSTTPTISNKTDSAAAATGGKTTSPVGGGRKRAGSAAAAAPTAASTSAGTKRSNVDVVKSNGSAGEGSGGLQGETDLKRAKLVASNGPGLSLESERKTMSEMERGALLEQRKKQTFTQSIENKTTQPQQQSGGPPQRVGSGIRPMTSANGSADVIRPVVLPLGSQRKPAGFASVPPPRSRTSSRSPVNNTATGTTTTTTAARRAPNRPISSASSITNNISSSSATNGSSSSSSSSHPTHPHSTSPSHTHRRPPSKGVDTSDDACFVCKDGGQLILCDFEGCPRAYHNACLGSRRPAPDHRNGGAWHCPWHACAICGKAEDSTDTPPRALARIPALESFPHVGDTPPALPPVPRSASSGQESSNTHEPVTFVRCCTCPLTLCDSCMDGSIRVDVKDPGDTSNSGKFGKRAQALVPLRGEVKRGTFFACVMCRGVKSAKTDDMKAMQSRIPGVMRARRLHLLWSRLANGHAALVRPFLLRNTISNLAGLNPNAPTAPTPHNSHKLVNYNQPDDIMVTCLDDIRCKIRDLAYPTFQSFFADVLAVSKWFTDRLQVVGADPRAQPLIESAHTLPMLLEEIVKKSQAVINDTIKQERLALRTLGELPAWREYRCWRVEGEQPSMQVVQERGITVVLQMRLHLWDDFTISNEAGQLGAPLARWMAEAASLGTRFSTPSGGDGPPRAVPGRKAIVPRSGGGGGGGSQILQIHDDGSAEDDDVDVDMNVRNSARVNIRNMVALLDAVDVAKDQEDTSLGGRASNEEQDGMMMDSTTLLRIMPPARAELEALIAEQSRVIRVVLQNHGRLRSHVDKLYKWFEGEDGEQLTLGEGRVAAQYASANRGLRRKVIDLERKLAEREFQA